MRYVTVCEDKGEQKVKGVDHKVHVYKMLPGSAWQINDETKEHHVVEIRAAEKAIYTFYLRWIDGRTVACFTGPDGKEYAQPVIEDPRAKERRIGSIRKVRKRKVRKEAPGVAPEAIGSMNIESLGRVPEERRSERVEARTGMVRASKGRRVLDLL